MFILLILSTVAEVRCLKTSGGFSTVRGALQLRPFAFYLNSPSTDLLFSV